MTAPDRYDRRDPCPDCGEPACRCGDDWPNDSDDGWADYCVPACPDDVCRSVDRCAWPLADPDAVRDLYVGDPARYGLRAVRDLRVRGEVL